MKKESKNQTQVAVLKKGAIVPHMSREQLAILLAELSEQYQSFNNQKGVRDPLFKHLEKYLKLYNIHREKRVFYNWFVSFENTILDASFGENSESTKQAIVWAMVNAMQDFQVEKLNEYHRAVANADVMNTHLTKITELIKKINYTLVK